MAKKKRNEDRKLHNFDEKLHNSHELDLSWQETVDLLPEDEVEGDTEIYYFVDEDGNIHVTPPEVIEIHPPFDDYCCSIDHFLDIYGTLEKRVLEVRLLMRITKTKTQTLLVGRRAL